MAHFPADDVDRLRRTFVKGVPMIGLGILGCQGQEGVAVGTASEGPGKSSPGDPRKEDLGRPRPPATEPRIRVRVSRIEEDVVEFGADPGRLWVTAPGDGYRAMHRGRVGCRRLESGWQITSQASGRLTRDLIAGSGPLTLVATETGRNGLEFMGRRLSGTVNLVGGGSSGKPSIDVVCHLGMESYLPGVLAGELFESWRPATHEAVAIAARSFALCERFHWITRRSYDVVADERSQVWTGGESHERAASAVRRTRGEVMLHRGRVVPGYYSSSCGGRPASAIDVISSNPVNGIEPLRVPAADRRGSCPCHAFGPHGSWRASFDARAFDRATASRAVAGSPPPRWPVKIELIETFDSGRPRRFRISPIGGRSKPLEMAAVDLQRALNGTAGGRPVRSADFEISVRSDGIQIDGAGFGHGVGLCQYGTESLARTGRSAREILARYYPGVEIRRVW